MKEVIRMFESSTSKLTMPPSLKLLTLQLHIPTGLCCEGAGRTKYADGIMQQTAQNTGTVAQRPAMASTDCGLNLTCQRDEADALLFLNTPTGLKFIVKSINYTAQTIKLAIGPLQIQIGDPLPGQNATGGFDRHLDYTLGQNNTVSVCSNPASAFSNDDYLYKGFRRFNFCKAMVSFPILASSFSSGFSDISLFDEFDLGWAVESMTLCADCTASGGRCGYSTIGNGFLCFCRHGSRYGNCNAGDEERKVSTTLAAGRLTAAVGDRQRCGNGGGGSALSCP
ncbi:hypothetical protein EJ110_NYTH22349 [Nymphaea thermarum]|nr:hypothetical protein EJ110_NYTH22349 [Nymphaea thermarum]